jgi:hypothetical protein
LILQDDPSFIPEIALPVMDLEALLRDPDSFNFAFETQSSIGTKIAFSPGLPYGDVQTNLVMPFSSSPPGVDGVGDFSSSFHEARAGDIFSQDVLLEDAEFELDEEGKILELPRRMPAEPQTPQIEQRATLGSGSGTHVHLDNVLGTNDQANFQVR